MSDGDREQATGERVPVDASPEALRACRVLLEAIVQDRGLLAALSEQERVALLAAAGRVARPTGPERRREARAYRRHKRADAQRRDRSAVSGAGIRAAREGAVFVAPPQLPDAAAATTGPELARTRNCYVCKRPYARVHVFYDSMCEECAELNYRKRFQSAPVAGRVALVTGARVKIGFQAALKLLRAGARVVVTTRFAHDAARRYAAEEDFDAWADRLRIYGLDLRHAPSVEVLCEHLGHALDRLDLLVNNAAQTVRRPPGFYAHLLELELQPLEALPERWRPLVADYHALRDDLRRGAGPSSGLSLLATAGTDALGRALRALPRECRTSLREVLVMASGGGAASGPDPMPAGGALAIPPGTPRRGLGLLEPARLSQLRASCDGEDGFDVFPRGRTDADLQQVDLRAHNSWRMTLGEVPTWEMLEVHLVNAVAPFVLASKLKPLMLRERTFEKHVVNVSAMEGSFSRGTKTDRHPHTNMAKAALNMMTLTSAPDYARDGIFMNAVDTGWVTDEDPALHAARKREQLHFQPPLDVVDGAARVCDPFFSGLLSGVHPWGKFFKDYRPTSW